MAVHQVDIKVPTLELDRADAILDVKADGVTLGALHISRGAVVWFPSGTTYGYKLGWSRLNELMLEHGTRSEAR
jgi:hypothetical protein